MSCGKSSLMEEHHTASHSKCITQCGAALDKVYCLRQTRRAHITTSGRNQLELLPHTHVKISYSYGLF